MTYPLLADINDGASRIWQDAFAANVAVVVVVVVVLLGDPAVRPPENGMASEFKECERWQSFCGDFGCILE